MAPEYIEYMCKFCGEKQSRPAIMGRPQPGNCPRKPKDFNGNMRPHTWVINRKKEY